MGGKPTAGGTGRSASPAHHDSMSQPCKKLGPCPLTEGQVWETTATWQGSKLLCQGFSSAGFQWSCPCCRSSLVVIDHTAGISGRKIISGYVNVPWWNQTSNNRLTKQFEAARRGCRQVVGLIPRGSDSDTEMSFFFFLSSLYDSAGDRRAQAPVQRPGNNFGRGSLRTEAIIVAVLTVVSLPSALSVPCRCCLSETPRLLFGCW